MNQAATEQSTTPALTGATAPRAWGSRMLDFLTDGSVSAMCDELARLTSVPVWLRDQSGEAIIPVWSDAKLTGSKPMRGAAGHPWSVVPEMAGRARAFEQLGLVDDGSSETFALPLRISTGNLGALVACLPRRAFAVGATTAETERHRSIRRTLLLLASLLCDVCEAQVAQRRRVNELDALYRLSSLLTSAGSPEELLQLALDLAIEVIGVDAGSIALLDVPVARADGVDVTADGLDVLDYEPVVSASRGLTTSWVGKTSPLSGAGQLRRLALAGAVVRVEDLTRDARIEDKQRVLDEGLVGMLSTGMRERGRPIGLLRLYTRSARAFTEAEGELLRAISEHSASAVVNARLRAQRQQDEKTTRQVRLAGSVQRRMLPRSVPRVGPFDVAAHYAPSFELGGDFYDFLELGGHLGILIGDVVGKGVPAALFMSAVRASLRAHAQDLYHIDEVLSRVNKALCEDTLDNEFATAWYGVADPHSLRLTYCGAGHDWPLLVRMPGERESRSVDDRDVQRLTADGMALGIDPTQKYPKGTFQLVKGDVLVAFTDGLHDATNFDGARFGGTRLRRAIVEVLAEEPNASATRIIDHVLAHLRQHTGLSPRVDDVTVVVMRVGPESA
jgi:phosphoserine phosphatase RsbU/P